VCRESLEVQTGEVEVAGSGIRTRRVQVTMRETDFGSGEPVELRTGIEVAGSE
jgi:hypothetical protein